MKRGVIISIIVIAALVVVGGGFYLSAKNKMSVPPNIPSGITSTLPPTVVSSTMTAVSVSTSTSSGESLSFNGITIHYPLFQFGLAANEQQLPVRSYIPPCDQGFNYCVYYNASTYKGTNFESAGISIKDVTVSFPAREACINANPDGYTGVSSTVPTTASPYYSLSVFANLGNAAAGHYATDDVYRLYYGGRCYEFDARIGESQYANYPAGSIGLFTKSDYNTLRLEMNNVISSITLSRGGKISIP